MANFWSARAIAEEALRKIGAYTKADTGPDPWDFDVAVSGLDLVLSARLSVDRFWFLVEDVYDITLTADQAAYNLMTELGSDWPSDGIIFPIKAMLSDGSDLDPLTIVRRDQWDEYDKDEAGTPDVVYFDRSDPNTIVMRTWPVIASSGWSIKLTAQKYAKDLSSPLLNPSVATGLPPAWNMWAVYELAAYLGDGSVRRLSGNDVDRYEKKAMELFTDLTGYANQEHADDDICEPWGMM